MIIGIATHNAPRALAIEEMDCVAGGTRGGGDRAYAEPEKLFNHRIIVTLAGLNARIGEQADVTLPM